MGPLGESRSRNGREEIELGGEDPEEPRIVPGAFFCGCYLLGLAML